MKLGPWILREQSPKGTKRETIVGLRVQVTLLEAKALALRILKRLKPRKAGSEIILPTGDDESGE